MVIVIKKRRAIVAVLIFVLIAVCTLLLIKPVSKILYPLKYEDVIEEYSREYNLDPFLVMGIISAESRFDEKAVSHKDAKGLMQLREDTARWCTEKFRLDVSAENLYEPDTNILIGCSYVSYLTELFDGHTATAVAAYNAGQGNVSAWLKNPEYSDDGKILRVIPFPETDTYVQKVLKRCEIYKKLYGDD